MQRKRKKNGTCKLQSTAVMPRDPARRTRLIFHASVMLPPGLRGQVVHPSRPEHLREIDPPHSRAKSGAPMPATIIDEAILSSATRRTVSRTSARCRSQNAPAICLAPFYQSLRGLRRLPGRAGAGTHHGSSPCGPGVAGIFVLRDVAEHEVSIGTRGKIFGADRCLFPSRFTDERRVATGVRQHAVYTRYPF